MRLVLVAALCALAFRAGAQGLPQGKETVTLDLQTEQVLLITQLIEQMGCGTVRQLILCQQAAELLKDIRRQAVAQQK